MKGLIRNNFYSMQGNIKMAFIIAAFLAFVPLFAVSAAFIPILISMQIFVFVVNTGTSLHADEMAKWNKFEITIPVKRGHIVSAKYISLILLITFGMVMGILTAILAGLSGKLPNPALLVYGYEFGLSLSIISTSMMYPLMLKFGTEKNELILVLSTFFALCIMLSAAAALSFWTNGMNLRHPLVGAVSTVAALIIFVISYFVSVKIHQSKEF